MVSWIKEESTHLYQVLAPWIDDEDIDQKEGHIPPKDTRRAMLGGLLGVAIMVIGVVLVGQVGDAKAKLLLESMLPTARFLCSAVMTAAATTLALMLTLLSISTSSDTDLKPLHYNRIRQIARMDVIVFGAATVLLMMLAIPIQQSENVPSQWYDIYYYGLLGACALLSGGLISIMLMIFNAVDDTIDVFKPVDNDPYLTPTSDADQSDSGSPQATPEERSRSAQQAQGSSD